jgi:hypothetical protein
VARYLHKLMAYKDEYEVARLSLDPRLEAAVAAEFGPGARISYRLHPPVLRALGLHDKLTLGPWFRPGFRALRALKVLRGTSLDPFGRTAVRRIERELITEYRSVVRDLLPRISPATIGRCVEIASLPDAVRGYEEIKLANVARYRNQLRTLTGQLLCRDAPSAGGRVPSPSRRSRPHPADEKVEDAAERNEDQAGDRPYPPRQEAHPCGQDHLSQAQDLPAGQERQAHKQDKRGQHRAHLLVPARAIYRGNQWY